MEPEADIAEYETGVELQPASDEGATEEHGPEISAAIHLYSQEGKFLWESS